MVASPGFPVNRPSIIAAALLGLCGAAAAQDSNNPAFAERRQAVQAFCAGHAQDCAELKQLHETARQTCQNPQSTVGACRSARQAARAKEQALESQGFPPPPRGMRRENGEAPPPG
jgi:hypothetical protein